MSGVKKFLRGVVTSYIYIIITSIVALWLTPYTLSFIDKSHYGYYVLLADILTWVNLLQFGVSGVFNSKAAMCIGKKDCVSLQKYTSTAQIMQGTSSVLVLVIGLILTLFIDKIVDTTGISKFDVVTTFLLALITSVVTIFKQPLSAILVANKQIHIDNILQLGLFIVQALLTVLFLNLGYSIVSLAASHLIAVIIITFITYIRVKRLPFKLNLFPGGFDKDVFVEMLSTGLWFSVGSIGQIFIYKVDKFFIGSYISLSIVTSYYITSKLYDFANVFYSNFVNISRPYFSQLYAKGESAKLSQLYDTFLNGSILLLVFICSAIYLVNPWFIGWWIKGDQAAYLGDTISFLIALSVILQSSILTNRVLLASTLYKVKNQGLTRVLEGTVKFLCSIFLISKYGIMGLLISSIISCISCSTIVMNYLSNKALDRSIRYQFANYIPYLSLLILLALWFIPNKLVGLFVLLSCYFVLALIVRKNLSADTVLLLKSIIKRK